MARSKYVKDVAAALCRRHDHVSLTTREIVRCLKLQESGFSAVSTAVVLLDARRVYMQEQRAAGVSEVIVP